MRHDEKVNLLLDYCYRNPEKTQEIVSAINDYIKKINAGG